MIYSFLRTAYLICDFHNMKPTHIWCKYTIEEGIQMKFTLQSIQVRSKCKSAIAVTA